VPAVPRSSVIVPVRNGAATLPRCLAALRQASADRPGDLFELVVVDDRSTDEGIEQARAAGARIVPSGSAGPAAARNAGAAQALGEILLFLDADVEVRPSTIASVLDRFDADPDLAALFGSYDDEPEAANFVSQYRNLLHHFIHQTAERESASFWAGCGAIRRSVFRAIGGFDERRYTRPAIEDIDLGLRLSEAGYRVRLDPGLQVRHLKRWTVYSMVRTDIFDRAYPWSKLLLSRGRLPDDLNLRPHHRWSAALVGVLAATLAFLMMGHERFYGLPAKPMAMVLVLLILAQLMPLNRKFYAFLIRRRGWIFAARAVPLHFLYYFYSGLTYVVCWASHHSRRLFPQSRRYRSAAGSLPHD
jgi:glycosyltransferase involved in cell wall biosynthesis